MPKWLRKRWRALQLALLARQDPDKLLHLSRQRVRRVYASAVAASPAYRTLVAEAGLDPGQRLDAAEVLALAPVLEKRDLFERFPLRELLRRQLRPGALANVLTSSGHGGGKFAFGLATVDQMRRIPDDIDLGLQSAFDIDHRDTLLVNCLPMGVVFSSRDVCVANVSVREDMALAILDQAGPLYDQVILCVDPLFCKRLLDYAEERSFDWSRLRCHMILGEETFPEDFRSYVATRLQVDLDSSQGALLGSSMGVGELGLNLFFETRETIALRRSLRAQAPDAFLPAFFCFNPLRTHVEVLEPGPDGVGDLVITMLDQAAPVPMIRYRTGDRARWVQAGELATLEPALRCALEAQPLPMLAMYGRDTGWIDGHWHVDHFKSIIYRQPALAGQCSGAFRVSSAEAGGLQLDIQLRRHADGDAGQVEAALSALVETVADSCGRPRVRVACQPYERFEHGMGLDYERKFRYFPGD